MFRTDFMEEFIDNLIAPTEPIALNELKQKIIEASSSLIVLTIFGVITFVAIKKFRNKKKLPMTPVGYPQSKEKNLIKEIKAEEIFEEDKKELISRNEFIDIWLQEFKNKASKKGIYEGIKKGVIILDVDVPKGGTVQTNYIDKHNDNEPFWTRKLFNDKLYTRIYTDNKPTPFITVKSLVNDLR